MPILRNNLAVVSESCIELASKFNDFWVVSALTDGSYEEGERNAHFKRSIEARAEAGVPESLLGLLREGTNGNLKSILERRGPGVGKVVRTKGKGQDLAFEKWENGAPAKIEVKLVYDCTLPKYYGSVAADWDKLQEVRLRRFAGDLFLVVFFVQLPGFDYPSGQWPGRAKPAEARRKYLRTCEISSQFRELKKWLAHPQTWPSKGPHIHHLSAL
ncbi:MAG: hypothetical protein JWN24_3480 [Phycisphaerales bacterium]|nr:hypothetical protein [Phycisphaerales bacterium]